MYKFAHEAHQQMLHDNVYVHDPVLALVVIQNSFSVYQLTEGR